MSKHPAPRQGRAHVVRVRAGRLRGGFTLVEVIATIVVLAIIGTATSSIMLTATDGYIAATVRSEVHTELSVGLDRIVREMRNIELDGSATGVAPDVDSVTASSIDWESDSTIELSGTTVELTLGGGPTSVLIDDVTAFSIQCYDEDDSAMAASLSGAACDAIRRIAVSITASRHGVTETLHTKLFVRSTMTGAAG